MKTVPMRESELWKRYQRLKELVGKVCDSYYREGWEDSNQSLPDLISDTQQFLSHEKLEEEIFEIDPIPVVPREEGGPIPDLRGREHICDFRDQLESDEDAKLKRLVE